MLKEETMPTNDSEERKPRKLTRREFLKASTAAGLGGMILVACGAGAGTGGAPAPSSAPAAGAAPTAAPAAAATSAPAAGGAMSMDQLTAAAKGEGTLTTIALPHDWLNYGEMIDNFKKKYGLQVNELDPNAG
jgi:hypothetical protein